MGYFDLLLTDYVSPKPKIHFKFCVFFPFSPSNSWRLFKISGLPNAGGPTWKWQALLLYSAKYGNSSISMNTKMPHILVSGFSRQHLQSAKPSWTANPSTKLTQNDTLIAHQMNMKIIFPAPHLSSFPHWQLQGGFLLHCSYFNYRYGSSLLCLSFSFLSLILFPHATSQNLYMSNVKPLLPDTTGLHLPCFRVGGPLCWASSVSACSSPFLPRDEHLGLQISKMRNWTQALGLTWRLLTGKKLLSFQWKVVNADRNWIEQQ